jgi:holo-[acyl-carrier protein] synthase
VRCGIDLAEPDRVGPWLDRYGDDALRLVFTAGELARARSARRSARVLTVCLAAKEAVGKALGTGLSDVDWTDIETMVTGPTMSVRLSGAAARLAAALGLDSWHGSWSTAGAMVTVVVVADTQEHRCAYC